MSVASALAELSKVRRVQPVNALSFAERHQAEFTEPLLNALERGLANQELAFAQDGILFNYATYLFAKWRERRAYPYFIRWLSLPGEGAVEVGGDTTIQDGGRLLASVCGGDVGPIKQFIQDPKVNEMCRAQGIQALAILAAWGEYSRQDLEEYATFLVRGGLERRASPSWDMVGLLILNTEALALFPDIRQACQERLCALNPAIIDVVAQKQRGQTFEEFKASQQPITDVVKETRWWAGFSPMPDFEPPAASEGRRSITLPGEVYVAPPKAGRNEMCPCGSGKKFKKCCGK